MSQRLKNNSKLQDQETQVLKIMIFLGVIGMGFSLLLTFLLN